MPNWMPALGSTPHEHDSETSHDINVSRRQLLGTAALGAAVGTLATAGLSPEIARANERNDAGTRGSKPGKGQDILLRGGVVLTMDPKGGDLARGDVLIQGPKIAAIGPSLHAPNAHVIDCAGMIILPGFIDTHHHTETQARNILADGSMYWAGRFSPGWPQEDILSVLASVWWTGRLGPAANPIWDIGRSPYDPEDHYIAELGASLTGIDQGITTAVDMSAANNSPAYTDAAIQGLRDSGRRTVFAYSGGLEGGGREDTPGYEFPGSLGDYTKGFGRLRKEHFSSNDQLVTLGSAGGPAQGPIDLSHWELAHAFGAPIFQHADDNGANSIVTPAVRAVLAQYQKEGFPIEIIHANRYTQEAFDVCAKYGVHMSLSCALEMQMGHGMPAIQECLRRGILPSLSGDSDTNMGTDMFTQMRGAFCVQRALINQRALRASDQAATPLGPPPRPGERLVTSYQILQMATWAGAAGAGLGGKVGRLVPGLEADIVVLNARKLSSTPLNNAPGAIVTAMDTSNVDTVIIRGTIKKRGGKLVGVDLDKVLNDLVASRDRILARIRGRATGSNPNAINEFLNSGSPYTPNFLSSCCINPDYIGVYEASPGTGALG